MMMGQAAPVFGKTFHAGFYQQLASFGRSATGIKASYGNERWHFRTKVYRAYIRNDFPFDAPAVGHRKKQSHASVSNAGFDQQVHLGFDLATTANAPISAAQRGVVVHADDLGIYGNCVVIDHGLGVQSLYGHLSSIAVKVGDKVEKGQEIGRSGQTGLAGGDHLHFTTLVGGEQVTPVDWWSTQWMQDRVLRKIAAVRGTP